jgi:hypothetical protein
MLNKVTSNTKILELYPLKKIKKLKNIKTLI